MSEPRRIWEVSGRFLAGVAIYAFALGCSVAGSVVWIFMSGGER